MIFLASHGLPSDNFICKGIPHGEQCPQLENATYSHFYIMSVVDISRIKVSFVVGVNKNYNFKTLKIQVNPGQDNVK